MGHKCILCEHESQSAVTSPFGHSIDLCGNPECRHMFVVDVQDGMGVCHQAKGVAQIRQEQERHFAEYAERNRHLLKDLMLRGYLEERFAVLDFGAGFGGLSISTKLLMPHCRIIGIEACENQRHVLQQQGFEVYPSLDDLPDIKFDLIFMIEVLEHIPNPVSLLSRISRHLSPRGSLLLTTPTGRLKNGDWGTGFGTESHLHFFSETSLASCLVQSGFRPPRYEYLRSLYPHPAIVDRWLQQFAAQGHQHLVTFVERA